MQILDLRDVRCPLSLVLLKRQLLCSHSAEDIHVHFSSLAAMQDIFNFLDKKGYRYACEHYTIVVHAAMAG